MVAAILVPRELLENTLTLTVWFRKHKDFQPSFNGVVESKFGLKKREVTVQAGI